MKKEQLTSMWIGIAVVIIMVLFPPWVGSKGNAPMDFVGYSPIYKQPTYRSATAQTSTSYMTTPHGEKKVIGERTYYPRRFYSQAQISYCQLYLQVFLVLLVTAGAILTQASRRANERQPMRRTNVPTEDRSPASKGV